MCDVLIVLVMFQRMLSSVALLVLSFVFFFNQKTAYEMRISDWSSDVCSSDLNGKSQGFATPARKKISTLPSCRPRSSGSIFLRQPLHLSIRDRKSVV